MEQGNRLLPSRETESAAYSESLVPTTVMGEGVLQLRSCVDPEFYSGPKGSGAGGHKGPFVQLLLVLIRTHRPAPRDHPQRPAHRGQPERGWLSSEGGWFGAWGAPLHHTTLRLCPHCSPCELCPPLPSPSPAVVQHTTLQALGSVPGPWYLLGEAICRPNCWQIGKQVRNQSSIHPQATGSAKRPDITLTYHSLCLIWPRNEGERTL